MAYFAKGTWLASQDQFPPPLPPPTRMHKLLAPWPCSAIGRAYALANAPLRAPVTGGSTGVTGMQTTNEAQGPRRNRKESLEEEWRRLHFPNEGRWDKCSLPTPRPQEEPWQAPPPWVNWQPTGEARAVPPPQPLPSSQVIKKAPSTIPKCPYLSTLSVPSRHNYRQCLCPLDGF